MTQQQQGSDTPTAPWRYSKSYRFRVLHQIRALPAETSEASLHPHDFELQLIFQSYEPHGVGWLNGESGELDPLEVFIDDYLREQNLMTTLMFESTPANILAYLFERFVGVSDHLVAMRLTVDELDSYSYEPGAGA